jgi:hypothetical protein
MNSKSLLTITFFAGFLTCAALQHLQVRFISEAKADVAGMIAYQLQNDRAFREAVKQVVEEECKTDIKFYNNMQTFKTWHYCNPGSQFAPR